MPEATAPPTALRGPVLKEWVGVHGFSYNPMLPRSPGYDTLCFLYFTSFKHLLLIQTKIQFINHSIHYAQRFIKFSFLMQEH